MLKELKKKSFQSSLKLTGFLTVAGLLLTGFFARDALLSRFYPILLFAGGIVLLCIAVYRLIKGAMGGYLRKLMQDIANSGYTEFAIDSDYTSAKTMDKWGIRLGQLMIYDISAAKVRAIPTTKILWAYTDLKSYQTKYGSDIPVNDLVLHIEGEAKEYRMVFSDEKTQPKCCKR